MKLHAPTPFRCLLGCQDGATALEFAIVSPVLFLLVMGVMEVAMVLTAQVVMESATFSASRLGKTGYVTKDKTQEETIKAEVARLGALFMDPSKIVVTSKSYTNYDVIGDPEPFVDANKNGVRDNGENYTDVNGNGQFDLDRGKAGYGAAEHVVIYTATYDWKLFTPLVSNLMGTNGIVTIRARAVVKNEPFG